VNVREVLTELGYSLTEYPHEFRTRPLYRDSSSNTVLSIKKDSGRWVDFSRNLSGSLDDLVSLTLGFEDVEKAEEWLKKRDFNFNTSIVSSRPKIQLAKTFDKSLLSNLNNDSSYWEKRRVSKETLELFSGGVAVKGKMGGRYVFPIFDFKKEIVGFAGRDIYNNLERPKWKLLGSCGSWVYPWHLSEREISAQDTVFLVESIGDCLSLYEAGIKNVLVTFGLRLGEALLCFLIRKDVKEIVVSLNNDDNLIGNKAAGGIRDKLVRYFDQEQISIKLPSKKDFGEMSKEEIKIWQTT